MFVQTVFQIPVKNIPNNQECCLIRLFNIDNVEKKNILCLLFTFLNIYSVA